MAEQSILVKVRLEDRSFQPDPQYELARILRELADQIEYSGIECTHNLILYDRDNNRVGAITYHAKEH